MIRYYCDLCKKEVLHKEAFYLNFKDAKGYGLGNFEICKRCFDELYSMTQVISVRDKQCL